MSMESGHPPFHIFHDTYLKNVNWLRREARAKLNFVFKGVCIFSVISRVRIIPIFCFNFHISPLTMSIRVDYVSTPSFILIGIWDKKIAFVTRGRNILFSSVVYWIPFYSYLESQVLGEKNFMLACILAPWNTRYFKGPKWNFYTTVCNTVVT